MNSNSNDDTKDFFEAKALKGDSGFAIAYALLELADAQQMTAMKLGRMGFDGPSGNAGGLEGISLSLEDIAKSIKDIPHE